MNLIKEEQEFNLTGKLVHESDKRLESKGSDKEMSPFQADQQKIAKSQSQLMIHPKNSTMAIK